MIDKNILYFTRTMGLGGTENVILQLCEIMNKSVNKIVVCSSGGVNVKKLSEMGIKHYNIPDIEHKSIRNIIKVLITVLRIIKNENITIVHTHHRMAAFYTMLLYYVNRIVFVNTVHNTFKDKRKLTRFAYKKANLIAVGNKVKENICNFYGIPDKQVTVIHNAVKPFDGKIYKLDIVDRYRSEGYFLVGNVGRLAEQKGMEYYIKASPIVLRKYPKVKFFIIGDGEDREKLEILINKLGLNEDIILLGYRNDIQNVMFQLDLIVLSSLWEGLPLTPIEAFSVGKTIVATKVDGTSEIVEDGVNGLLIEARNEISIAKGIINLIENDTMREKKEKKAMETYAEKFSYEILAKRYINYYTHF